MGLINSMEISKCKISSVGDVWRSAVVTVFFIMIPFLVLTLVGPFHICAHCLFGQGNHLSIWKQSFLVYSLLIGYYPLVVYAVLCTVFVPLRLFIEPPVSALSALAVGTLIGFGIGMLLLFFGATQLALVMVFAVLSGIVYMLQSFVAYYKPVLPTREDAIEPSTRNFLNRFRKACDWIVWGFSPVMLGGAVGYLWIRYRQ